MVNQAAEKFAKVIEKQLKRIEEMKAQKDFIDYLCVFINDNFF